MAFGKGTGNWGRGYYTDANLLRAVPGRFLNDENNGHRQDQTEYGHRNEQDAQLAVIRWHEEGASRRVADFTSDKKELVQVFGAQRAEGQRQVGERCHDGEESGFELRWRA